MLATAPRTPLRAGRSDAAQTLHSNGWIHVDRTAVPLSVEAGNVRPLGAFADNILTGLFTTAPVDITVAALSYPYARNAGVFTTGSFTTEPVSDRPLYLTAPVLVWAGQLDVTPSSRYFDIVMPTRSFELPLIGLTPSTLGLFHVPSPAGDQDWSEITDTPAARATRDLQDWLGLTLNELAPVLGVSRSALLFWRRTGAEPRSADARRRLLRLHSLLRGVRRSTSPRGFTAALDARAANGKSVRALVMDGDVTQAEELLDSFIFGSRRREGGWRPPLVGWPDPTDAGSTSGPELRLRAPSNRRSRTTLRRSD